MHTHNSLPMKLCEIRRDLHAFLQTEPASGERRDLIEQADKAIDRVIREFELDSLRVWLTDTTEDPGIDSFDSRLREDESARQQS